MKKIITWLASFILATSTAPAISQLVLNTNFNNQKDVINYSNKIFDNQNFKTEFIDPQQKAEFKEAQCYLKTKDKTFVGTHKNGLWESINGIDFIQNVDTSSWGIISITKDSKDNVYFGAITSWDSPALFGLYVLKNGESKPKKCLNDDSKPFNVITIDSHDNMYLGAYPSVGGEVGAFIFKNLDFDNPIALRDIKDRILSINIDKNNNVYFGAEYVDYLWVLKSGATKPEKIRGVPGQPKTSIESINFDSENNMYLGTENGLIKSIDKVNFILIKTTENQNIPHSVNKDVLIDEKNNVYFGVFDVYDELSELYILENGTQTPKKIFEKIKNSVLWIDIDNKNNIYFVTKSGFYFLENILNWTKNKTNFSLKDKTKSMYWLNNNQIVTNGQLHLKIEGNEIDDVKIDGQSLPYTNKTWTTDLPEDFNKKNDIDFKISTYFTIDSKRYNSEIIVSSLLTTPTISINKTIGGSLKDYSGILPNASKIGDIPLTKDVFYSETAVEVKLERPTPTTSLTCIVYGLNQNWEKNGESKNLISEDELIEKIKIMLPKFVNIPDEYTNNFDISKITFKIFKKITTNQFKPNDVVSVTVFYNGVQSLKSFELKIEKQSNNNGGLSLWSLFGIILGSGLFLIGVPYCIYKFYIVPKKVAKRWKKFKQESQENNESEGE